MIVDIFKNLIYNNLVLIKCNNLKECNKLIVFLKQEVNAKPLYEERVDTSSDFPVFVLINKGKDYEILHNEKSLPVSGYLNLTYFANKFFDDLEFMSNLQPTSDEERNFLNCALAMFRGYKIEYYDEKNEKWKLAKPNVIKSKYIYRPHVVQNPTPLKIPESILKVLNPKWKWFAMDGNGQVWCFESKPKINYFSKSWFGDKFWDDYLEEYIYLNEYMNISRIININTDGIVWDYSLTERQTE